MKNVLIYFHKKDCQKELEIAKCVKEKEIQLEELKIKANREIEQLKVEASRESEKLRADLEDKKIKAKAKSEMLQADLQKALKDLDTRNGEILNERKEIENQILEKQVVLKQLEKSKNMGEEAKSMQTKLRSLKLGF